MRRSVDILLASNAPLTWTHQNCRATLFLIIEKGQHKLPARQPPPPPSTHPNKADWVSLFYQSTLLSLAAEKNSCLSLPEWSCHEEFYWLLSTFPNGKNGPFDAAVLKRVTSKIYWPSRFVTSFHLERTLERRRGSDGTLSVAVPLLHGATIMVIVFFVI